VGKAFKQGQSFGVVESVKAASDLYMPMDGTITAVNEALPDEPGPDQHGCLCGVADQVQAIQSGAFQALMDVAAYEAFVASEAH